MLATWSLQPDAVYEHAMMSLLDRYILRELWPSFVLALVVATFVLFADKLLWLTSLILRNHLDPVTSVRLLGYTLPTVSGLTLPIAFLIGCTLTFNRLSMDSEYVVFRAAGISLGRMLVPGRGGCGRLWSVQFCPDVCVALGISGAATPLL